ncbi:MAG TPA: ABC transporter ATP-binding protein [Anaerolineae bacterium]|nr:ABC transporter ATP-binding protein [Anaerolineae bacterium]
MPEIIVKDLSKRFGDVVAVNHISFTVQDGEFLTLLGPSGCGKTTTLFAIAGLDHPDTGLIRVGESTFFDSSTGQFVVPEKRNCGMVFQSYALWPHMNVYENLAFPLRLRKVSKKARDERIAEILNLVELELYKDRYPHQLSGGQQQRVALGRALVYSPTVLLLDEPLSNLDAKLRERARSWLKRIQSRLGITSIYVTHDQTEALVLSDRIAVMREGRICQVGSPQDIYASPAEPFVADFIGTSNFLRGHMAGAGEDGTILVDLDAAKASIRINTTKSFAQGAPLLVSIRPEKVRVVDRSRDAALPAGNWLEAEVVDGIYVGACYRHRLRVDRTTLRAETEAELTTKRVWVSIPDDACAVFEADPAQDSASETPI